MPPEATLKVKLHVGQGGGRELPIDVSFEAPPGVTILFGPSGAGKSTTLQAVAGILRPESGRISLGDEVWFDSEGGTDVALEKRGIAYVFQSLALFPHMTALGNVAYGIDRRVTREERRARASAMLERMRVSHLAHRRPSTFSGGEAQRVALARAFARAPRLVLLDEPFSALDRELRRDFVEDVRAYIEEARIPLVHVTHHRNEARILGHRIVLLEAGKVKATGDVDTLLPPSSAMDESMPLEIGRGGAR